MGSIISMASESGSVVPWSEPPSSSRLETWEYLFLYDRVLYFGSLEAPILYYDTYVLWCHILDVNEKLLWQSILIIYMCEKMYVCDMLMVYETNANLTHS